MMDKEEQGHWDHALIINKLCDEIERLREEVDELVKERNRYKRVCLQIVADSKEESDISDFVLYIAKEALEGG